MRAELGDDLIEVERLLDEGFAHRWPGAADVRAVAHGRGQVLVV